LLRCMSRELPWQFQELTGLAATQFI